MAPSAPGSSSKKYDSDGTKGSSVVNWHSLSESSFPVFSSVCPSLSFSVCLPVCISLLVTPTHALFSLTAFFARLLYSHLRCHIFSLQLTRKAIYALIVIVDCIVVAIAITIALIMLMMMMMIMMLSLSCVENKSRQYCCQPAWVQFDRFLNCCPIKLVPHFLKI